MTTDARTDSAGVSVNGHGAMTDPIQSPQLSDAGNAERFARDHHSRVRFVHPLRKWFLWDDRRYAPDDTGAVVGLAKSTVKKIYSDAPYAETPADRAELARHAIKSEAEPRLSAMLKLAASEPGIPVRPSELDANPMMLNTFSGTVNLATATAQPHQSHDLITKLAPVVYDPDAACPLWEAVLHRIFASNTQLIAFVQRAIGYGLTGDTSEQCFFVLWGAGANGKTTLLTTIFEMLGDYAVATRPETFMVKGPDSIPNDVARLRGARFVIATEASQGHRLAESLVKQVTGGDVVTARFMRSEFFDFTPTFKVFFGTNHKPVIRGTDHAMWRRVRLIPFTVAIPEAEQDKHLKTKLRAEWPGILRWAIDGCLAWQRNGLGMPEEVRAAIETYRQEMDLLGEFLRDRCICAPAESVGAATLYETYLAWCNTNNEKPLSQTALGRQLGERGFPPARIKAEGRIRRGLRLRTSSDPEPGDGSGPGDGLGQVFPVNALTRAREGEPGIRVTTCHPSLLDEPGWVRE